MGVPVIIGVVFGIVFLILPIILIRRLLASAAKEISGRYPEHTIRRKCPMANLFGIKSKGMKQVRGNGILLLTDSVLYFRMLLPRREVLVQVGSITAFGTVKSFLGKTKGVKLLRVDFVPETGGSDSAAWAVRDLEGWVETLSTLTGSGPQSF